VTALNIHEPEVQHMVAWAVQSGDLRMATAHRLLFPEDKATAESMELRELFDNHQLYQGRVI
jgi:hypothetical protein